MIDRLLSRLERRIGYLAIPNLAAFMAALMAVVFVLDIVANTPLPLSSLLTFDVPHILHGQVWRIVTFIPVIPGRSPIWTVVRILMYWSIGTSLEQVWGTFKFNAYYFLGALFTMIAGVIAYVAFPQVPISLDGYYVHIAVFLAFGTVFPEAQFNLYFLIPVKAKWLAMLSAGYLVYLVIFPPGDSIAVSTAIVVAMANYLLFFGPQLLKIVAGLFALETHRTKHAEALRVMRVSKQSPLRVVRSCKVCGASDAEGADLRVCVCQEVCHGKPTVYCLEHARSHQKKPGLN